MIILFNSVTHHSGQSTSLYLLNRFASNLVGTDTSIVSMGESSFYETAITTPYPGGHEDIQTVLAKTPADGIKFLKSSMFSISPKTRFYDAGFHDMKGEEKIFQATQFITRLGELTPNIYLDLGNQVNTFTSLGNLPAKIVIVTPPDLDMIRKTRKKVIEKVKRFKEETGDKFTTDIQYLIPRFNDQLSMRTIQNELECTAKELIIIRDLPQLYRARNQGRLDDLFDRIMVNPKASQGEAIFKSDIKTAAEKLMNRKFNNKAIYVLKEV